MESGTSGGGIRKASPSPADGQKWIEVILSRPMLADPVFKREGVKVSQAWSSLDKVV